MRDPKPSMGGRRLGELSCDCGCRGPGGQHSGGHSRLFCYENGKAFSSAQITGQNTKKI
jgi:hypothetical protein